MSRRVPPRRHRLQPLLFSFTIFIPVAVFIILLTAVFLPAIASVFSLWSLVASTATAVVFALRPLVVKCVGCVLDEDEEGFTMCVIVPDDPSTDPATARSGASMEAAVDPKVWAVGKVVDVSPGLPLGTVALPPSGVEIAW